MADYYPTMSAAECYILSVYPQLRLSVCESRHEPTFLEKGLGSYEVSGFHLLYLLANFPGTAC